MLLEIVLCYTSIPLLLRFLIFLIRAWQTMLARSKFTVWPELLFKDVEDTEQILAKPVCPKTYASVRIFIIRSQPNYEG